MNLDRGWESTRKKGEREREMSNSDEELDDIDMNDPPGLFEGETYNFEEEQVFDISLLSRPLGKRSDSQDLYSKQRSKEKNRAGALKDLDVGFKLMQLSHENLHDIIMIRMQAHKLLSSLPPTKTFEVFSPGEQ